MVKTLSDERKINMPIVDSLYKIIYKGENLDGSIQNILGEDLIKDVNFSNKIMTKEDNDKITDVVSEEVY